MLGKVFEVEAEEIAAVHFGLHIDAVDFDRIARGKISFNLLASRVLLCDVEKFVVIARPALRGG